MRIACSLAGGLPYGPCRHRDTYIPMVPGFPRSTIYPPSLDILVWLQREALSAADPKKAVSKYLMSQSNPGSGPTTDGDWVSSQHHNLAAFRPIRRSASRGIRRNRIRRVTSKVRRVHLTKHERSLISGCPAGRVCSRHQSLGLEECAVTHCLPIAFVVSGSD